MELVPVSTPVKKMRKGSNIKIIQQFLEMDADVVEVKDYYCNSAVSAYTSLLQTIKKHGFNVAVTRRKDKIYLIKEDK